MLFRSVIFSHNETQAVIAQKVITEAQSQLKQAVVTELSALPIYYRAEDMHQNYFVNYPFQGYCAGVVGPKVAKFKATQQHFLRSSAL